MQEPEEFVKLTTDALKRRHELGSFTKAFPPVLRGIGGHQERTVIRHGMRIDYDTPIKTRDGVTLRANIWFPEKASETLPVIFSYNLYGKDGGLDTSLFPPGARLDEARMTPDYGFETLDTQWWTSRGYICADVDARGSFKSEGDKAYYTRDVGLDGYDVVEWLGTQPWSNGKVGMYGASAFAMVQWQVASEKPPHLACIMPFDGISDLYRDYACQGGIPETQFSRVYTHFFNWGSGDVEDSSVATKEHPFFDSYWAEKVPRLTDIECPAYIVCGWGDNCLHTRGTLWAYIQVSSEEKWLEIHAAQKWEWALTEESLQRQLAFYEKFLKGQRTEVEYWPKVRWSLRERFYVDEWRFASTFPLPDTQYTKLYPTPSMGLSVVPQPSTHAVSYDALNGEVVYELPLMESLEFAGWARLKLWVEAQGGNDLDLIITLRKVDSDGKEVNFPWLTIIENGPIAFGMLRASLREIDEEKSTIYRPWIKYQREMLLKAGQVVPVDIEIGPTSARFRPGEKLQVYISGHDYKRNEYPPMIPVVRHEKLVNNGTAIVHFGGKYDSYLQLPIVPPVKNSKQQKQSTARLMLASRRVPGWSDEKFLYEFNNVHANMTKGIAEHSPLLLGYTQVTGVPQLDFSVYGCPVNSMEVVGITHWASKLALKAGFRAPEYKESAGSHVLTDNNHIVGSVCTPIGDIVLDPIGFHKRSMATLVVTYIRPEGSGPSEDTFKQRLADVAAKAGGKGLLRYVINEDVSPKDKEEIGDFFGPAPFAHANWAEFAATEEWWFKDEETAKKFFNEVDLAALPSGLTSEGMIPIAGWENVVFGKKKNL